MADQIFPTDFTERTAATAQDGDKILVQGTSAATTQYIQVGTIAKELTGLNSVPAGQFPRMGASGKLEDSGVFVENLAFAQNGSAGFIPIYLYSRTLSQSFLKVGELLSWISSNVSGIFKANVNINNNTLVGRIGVDNGTRGLSLGFYNNGSRQRVAMHASSSNAVSSTPQWLVTEAELQAYMAANSLTKTTVTAAQADAEKLPTFTFDNGVITIPNFGDYLQINFVEMLTNNYCLIRNENTATDNINGVYIITNDGSLNGDDIVLTRVGQFNIVEENEDDFAKTYFKYMSNSGELKLDNYKTI